MLVAVQDGLDYPFLPTSVLSTPYDTRDEDLAGKPYISCYDLSHSGAPRAQCTRASIDYVTLLLPLDCPVARCEVHLLMNSKWTSCVP